MARTHINHAVHAAFYIGGVEAAEQLAVFCSIKKLAWSPDVKIAMTKLPASNVNDAAWAILKEMTQPVLQGLLADLLKPIKEHQLFDLSDWLRDLDGVPDYLKEHWTNNRVPKALDDVLKKAIANGADGPGAVLNPAWPMPPSREVQGSDEFEEEDAGVVDSKPVARRTKPKQGTSKGTLKFETKFSGKTLKGPAGRGKVKKSEFIGAMDSSVDVLVDAARNALGDKKMVKTASKAVWTRVHKAVEALLNQCGMETTATRPQREETEDPQQAMVTYYIKPSHYGANGWHDFKAEFLTNFDGLVIDMQAVNDEEPPKSFKVWFEHA